MLTGHLLCRVNKRQSYLFRALSDTHGWGHGFIHGERQGTCAGVSEVNNSKEYTAANIEEEIEQANIKGKSQWEIRQAGNKGFGIFALRDFSPKELVFRATALNKTLQRTSHSVQTDWNRHVSILASKKLSAMLTT